MLDKQSYEKLSNRIESLERELKSVRDDLKAAYTGQQVNPAENQAPIHRPAGRPDTPPKPAFNFDLEMLLGGNILGKLGLVALILASLWFIKFAFDNYWINESGRIYIGLLSGFGVSGLGLFLAKQKYRILPASIFGTGFAILYLSIFGSYYFYDLLNIKETFLGLSVLSVLTAVIAGGTGLELIYIFSLAGSVLSPVLLSSGENSYKFLFFYLSFVNLLFFYIARNRDWKVAPFLLLFSNTGIYSAWLAEKMKLSSFTVPYLYLNLTFILFTARELIQMPVLRKGVAKAGVFILILVTLFFSIDGYLTVRHFHPDYAPHFLLSIALFLSLGYLFFDRKARSALSDFIRETQFQNTVLFAAWMILVFSALSIYSEGKWKTVSWVVFAGSISILGAYYKNKVYLLASLVPWFFTGLRLLFSESNYNRHVYVLLNYRFFVFALASILLALTFYVQRKRSLGKYMQGFLYASLFFLIWGSLMENRYLIRDSYFRTLGYSVVLGLYMAALLISGFRMSLKPLRMAGIGLGVLIVAKFYLYDMWQMNLLVRIIAAFAMGAGLVILSIFYQKFRDKINMNLLKLLIVSSFLFSASGAVNADPFNPKTYHFVREVKGEIPDKATEEAVPQYGKMKLPDDLFKHSGYYDIRLVYGKEYVPFFIRHETVKKGKNGEVTPDVIFSNTEKNKTTYVLKLPEIPQGTEYKEIEVIGSSTFESNVSISLGKKANEWEDSQSSFIYNYKDKQNGDTNRIKFNSGKYRYVRLEFDSNNSFTFPRVFYESIQEKIEFKKEVQAGEIIKSFDPDINASLVYMDNPDRKPITRIVLNFEEKRFTRLITVYEKRQDTKEYEELASVNVKRTPESKEEIQVEFPRTTGNPIKIAITEGDDKPLTLNSITSYSDVMELVFKIPEKVEGNALNLYYGNQYARAPEFDINTTFEENEKLKTFQLLEHKDNAEFAFTFTEPPMSSWVIRITFLLGLLAVSVPAFSIFRKYSIEMNTPEQEETPKAEV